MNTPAAPAHLPGALPIVGHGLAFWRDRLGVLDAARSAGGTPIVRVPDPVVVLCEPEDVQHVLVTGAGRYVKGPKLASDRGQAAFGEGLLTTDGQVHRRLRRLVQPAFSHLAVERVREAACSGILDAINDWAPGVRDVHDDLMKGARLAIQRALFGRLPDEAEIDAAIAERRAFAQRWFAALGPRPERRPTRANRRYSRSHRYLTNRVATLVDERLVDPSARDDLVSLLAARESGDGERLSRDELVSEAVMLTVPGHETVGESLAWTLDLLARHPAQQGRARAAADRDDTVTLGHVVDESLRLYPPTWIVVRVAVANDTLPSGPHLTHGTRLYVSPWIVHRDPRWWPQPETFRPQRFTEPGNTTPRRSFIPFGAGPRVCLGERLARAELTDAVAHILRHWQLRPTGPPPRPTPGLTLAPAGGVRLELSAL